MDRQSLSLEESALSFLTTLEPEDRNKKQQEINKFIIWYGKERSISQLTALDVANYAEQVGASTNDASKKLEPVKAFLSYAKKEKLIDNSLAPHLRVRQPSQKTTKKSVKTTSKKGIALT